MYKWQMLHTAFPKFIDENRLNKSIKEKTISQMLRWFFVLYESTSLF
jgi:hypothetical protein